MSVRSLRDGATTSSSHLSNSPATVTPLRRREVFGLRRASAIARQHAASVGAVTDRRIRLPDASFPSYHCPTYTVAPSVLVFGNTVPVPYRRGIAIPYSGVNGNRISASNPRFKGRPRESQQLANTAVRDGTLAHEPVHESGSATENIGRALHVEDHDIASSSRRPIHSATALKAKVNPSDAAEE